MRTDRPELDPALLSRLAAQRTTRRRFIGRGSLAAATAFVLGPGFLAACGDDDDDSETSSTGASGQASGNLRVSNWPAYMEEGFVAGFDGATGISTNYLEDFNDNEQWFAKVKDPLSRKQDIGADLVVPTEFMAGRLIGLEWLNEINEANWSNKGNLRSELLDSSVDPGRVYTAPYMSGLLGLGYNKALTGREISSVDDLFDPQFAGQVSMFSDVRDGLGMVMLSQGNSPADATTETVQQAADKVQEEVDKGQIRRFTGNDYLDDLAAGNLVIAQAYSGDVVQLQADNPDLEFVVPSGGSTDFIDTMVIPYTTQNQAAAEAWINYIYDRENYATLVNFVQYVPVLSDMTSYLEELDPEVASNPLINPPQDVLDLITSWPSLTDEQEQEFATIYAEVTGG
jgi:spermidine/putrescine transport system substrate-binding protein